MKKLKKVNQFVNFKNFPITTRASVNFLLEVEFQNFISSFSVKGDISRE
jgi:hypothetical protein